MKTLFLTVCFLASFNLFAKTIYFENHAFNEQKPNISDLNPVLVFSHSFSSIEVNKAGEFEQVELKGLSLSDTPHLAKMPFYSFLVQAKADDIDYELVKLKEQELTHIKLKPAPEMPCRCADDALPKELNKGLYLSDDRKMVEVEYLGDFRGTPISRIKIFGGVYQAADEKLKVYSELEIKFSSNNGPLQLFNGTNEQGKRYLILTPSLFKEEIEELKDYRESQGHQVQIALLEEMGSSFSEVQSFVKSIWEQNPFDYALIVGHEDLFPTEYVDTSNDAQTPSDFNYFTFGGENDSIPDVFYGRMPVEKESEVVNLIKKIKEFERTQYKDASGLKKQIGIASNEGDAPSDVEYLNQMQNPLKMNLGVEPKAFLQDNKDATASNIVRALNEGALWVNYIGHGSGNSWISINRGEFHSDNVKSLKSNIVKPIVIDVSCQNGRFNYEGRLGERFMNETRFSKPIGAVAFYGGSVDISWHPPAVMAVKISELFAQKTIETLGDLLLQGQVELLKSYSDGDMAKENLVWYHLLGDPALRLQY